MTTYHFTRISSNAKTGPIPVTTTSPDSCPPTCSFLGAGCYASNGPLAIHWRAVGRGERGGTLEELCEKISELPEGQLWRHNQAGDLPPWGLGYIDNQALLKITIANFNKRGFTYTHYKPIVDGRSHNLNTLRDVNLLGFTVNLSAESMDEADEYYDTGLPVVMTLPSEVGEGGLTTPRGRPIVVCPATTGNTDCLNCGLCQKRGRTSIVGFPAHGSQSAHVQTIFFAKDIHA